MLYIMTCEGEEVLKLVDLNDMTDEQFDTKMYNDLTDEETNIICNMSFEGVVMTTNQIIEYDGDIVECTYNEYINSLKEYCRDSIEANIDVNGYKY